MKVLTTGQDPAKGLVHAALRALQAGGREAKQVRLILHGTTLATNAVLERKGAAEIDGGQFATVCILVINI